MNRALTLKFAAAALLATSLLGCDKPAAPPAEPIAPPPPAAVAPPAEPPPPPAAVRQAVKADKDDKNPSKTPEVGDGIKQAPGDVAEKEATKVDPKLKEGVLPGGKALPTLVPNAEAPVAEPARTAVPGGVRQGGRVPAMLQQAAVDAGH